MNRFLFWLSSFLPFREISDGDTPYLERYYLFTLLGWRFYLHQFVGSDPDRSLHDHPWSKAYSLILSGWYYEETRSGTRKVRWFNSLTGDTFHRVVLPDEWENTHDPAEVGILRYGQRKTGRSAPCWTLFMHRAGNVKPWGFWREWPERYEGAATFDPYTYEREGNQKDWWLTAKRRGQA
jgi:hypothetical protein